MKRTLATALLLAALAPFALAQKPSPAPPTLRSILLAQLHASHDTAEWFTPTNTATANLTAAQASWVPTNAAGKSVSAENHSVAMLTAHLVYWNERMLHKLRGQKNDPAVTDNEDSFIKSMASPDHLTDAQWLALTHRLDTIMRGLEDWTTHATNAQIAEHATDLSHIATHNAYHTGQILYVRKLAGNFNPANGVR